MPSVFGLQPGVHRQLHKFKGIKKKSNLQFSPQSKYFMRPDVFTVS